MPSNVRTGSRHILPDPAPDTGKEEQATPRPTEAAAEDGQVKFDDKAPNWGLSAWRS